MSYLVAIVLSSVITLFGVLVYQNVAGGEKKIERQLPRLYETDDREFRRSLSALLGPPIVEGNKVDTLINGDDIFPSMLAAIRGAQAYDHLRNLHLLVGQHRPGICRCAGGARGRRGAGACAARLGGSAKMDQRSSTPMKRTGVEVERFHEPHWYDTGPTQQPHPPQVADRRWPGGLHGWRGHRGPVARQRAGPDALARHALSRRRSRGRARCRRYLWTTGCGPRAGCSMANATSQPLKPAGTRPPRCSAVRPRAAARACT